MQLGIYTFGDLTGDPETGRPITAAARMRQMIDLARQADAQGLDIVGVGEHHGAGFVNSATAATIAAMAAVTERIRFTSASTLLSTADPVRTFQEFATADLVSGGRVELVFGRGAFTDNFPLFGFDLKDYDALFLEKLDLFSVLNKGSPVTWSGRFRPPLNQAEIAPRPVQKQLPVFIGAVSRDSVERAAMLGYPLAMPLLGGKIAGYAQLAAAYRAAWDHAGHSGTPRIAAYSHLHVSRTEDETRQDFYPYYAAYMKPLFRGQAMPREVFEDWLGPESAFVGGTVAQVVDKLSRMREAIGFTRYVGQIDIGGQPAERVSAGLSIFATEVAGALR
ncbi:LLM class flavin-dependent oxidoreductase [Mesobacterium pallidum]|uniref:LLM class flavin-dependent oxidoreductase n=1 Tax=Mesobacterium pallidum TaxID=2872037 RepID=UPI001EE34AFF|nr:LLM class flavin-dependent oxidoreductase [Mesobacterium pallidum]